MGKLSGKKTDIFNWALLFPNPAASKMNYSVSSAIPSYKTSHVSGRPISAAAWPKAANTYVNFGLTYMQSANAVKRI